jgi:hypothetical protein
MNLAIMIRVDGRMSHEESWINGITSIIFRRELHEDLYSMGRVAGQRD